MFSLRTLLLALCALMVMTTLVHGVPAPGSSSTAEDVAAGVGIAGKVAKVALDLAEVFG